MPFRRKWRTILRKRIEVLFRVWRRCWRRFPREIRSCSKDFSGDVLLRCNGWIGRSCFRLADLFAHAADQAYDSEFPEYRAGGFGVFGAAAFFVGRQRAGENEFAG